MKSSNCSASIPVKNWCCLLYTSNQVLQPSEMEIALKETQTRFYALDLRNAGHAFSIDDGFNLLKLHVKEAEKDGALNLSLIHI